MTTEDARPRVAAVVVSYNTRELTLQAVASVLSSRGVAPQVWVVDNGSRDGSAAAVRARFPEARVIELPGNVGFGRANNAALAHIQAPWVLLLNSDAAFQDDDGLARLIAALASDPRVGVVGPRLVHPDGRPSYSVRAFPNLVQELTRPTGLDRLLSPRTRERRLAREFLDHGRRTAADWLTGACLLVRGEVLRAVGGFDPAIFLYSEDLDWCWRVRRAGWEILLEPSVVVVHHEGASGDLPLDRRGRLGMAGQAYVVRKHRGRAYLTVFALARVLGLSLRWLGEGAAALLTGSERRRERSRGAAAALRAWVGALVDGNGRLPADPNAASPARGGPPVASA